TCGGDQWDSCSSHPQVILMSSYRKTIRRNTFIGISIDGNKQRKTLIDQLQVPPLGGASPPLHPPSDAVSDVADLDVVPPQFIYASLVRFTSAPTAIARLQGDDSPMRSCSSCRKLKECRPWWEPL